MLFFDSSQLLVLLAFMLMIDVIDCIMLIRGKQSIWNLCSYLPHHIFHRRRCADSLESSER